MTDKTKNAANPTRVHISVIGDVQAGKSIVIDRIVQMLKTCFDVEAQFNEDEVEVDAASGDPADLADWEWGMVHETQWHISEIPVHYKPSPNKVAEFVKCEGLFKAPIGTVFTEKEITTETLWIKTGNDENDITIKPVFDPQDGGESRFGFREMEEFDRNSREFYLLDRQDMALIVDRMMTCLKAHESDGSQDRIIQQIDALPFGRGQQPVIRHID